MQPFDIDVFWQRLTAVVTALMTAIGQNGNGNFPTQQGAIVAVNQSVGSPVSQGQPYGNIGSNSGNVVQPARRDRAPIADAVTTQNVPSYSTIQPTQPTTLQQVLLSTAQALPIALPINKTSTAGVCTTAGCVLAANNFLTTMDLTADPCENFYQYACGKFMANNPIPDDKSSYGTLSATDERLSTAMRSLLQDDKIKLKINSKAVNFTRLIYQQCANTSRLAEIGSAPLLGAIKSLGGWPLLNVNWTPPANFSLAKMLASLYTGDALPVNPFWSFYVMVDVKNTTRYILNFDDASVALPREYFLNATRYQSYLNAYEKYIRDILELLAKDGGIALQAKDVDAGVKDMLKFETEIARYKTAREDRRNKSLFYNLRTLRQLKLDIPNIDWQTFLTSIMPKDVQLILTDDLQFNVGTPAFMSSMSQLLNKTDTKTLVNYAIWKEVKASVDFLDERYRDIAQNYDRVLSGQEVKSPRWQTCANDATFSMELASGALYVDSHFSNDDKEEVDKMVKNLFESLGGILRDSDWMDDVTKAAALNKLKFILPHLGYPEAAKNATALDDYYKELNYSAATGFFQSAVVVSKWVNQKNFRDLLKVVDRNKYEDTAAIVNAFYDPSNNIISFPAGFLQPPVFHGSYPKYVNYGGMGSVIGHELTHAFDDQGSQFDEVGRLRNWWSNSSMANFQTRTECIVNQFNGYEVPEIKLRVNGKLTQGENIADSGGLKEAYRAYRAYVQKLGHEEDRLPGLDLSNDQVFFLSFATAWCEQSKPDSLQDQLLMDPHSPGMFRAIGTLSNMPEFAAFFKCKPGSQMNPTRRCSVW